jgi:hypothetical protein
MLVRETEWVERRVKEMMIDGEEECETRHELYARVTLFPGKPQSVAYRTFVADM